MKKKYSFKMIITHFVIKTSTKTLEIPQNLDNNPTFKF